MTSRYDRVSPRKIHTGFTNFIPGQTAADTKERPDDTMLEQEQFGKVQVGGHDAGQSGQFSRNVLSF